jgi:hypothetical protein
MMAGKILKTVTDLRRAARQCGATVENDSSGRWHTYQVCTPEGKCWEEDLHMLKVCWRLGDPAEWRSAAIEDAIERMESYGSLSDCANPECDYCHPEE